MSTFILFPRPGRNSIHFAYRAFNGRGVDLLQYLHERYEKVVRVRPNKLSYVDLHLGLKFCRTGLYFPSRPDGFLTPRGLIPNMTKVMSRTEHNMMRRILAPGFSDRALRKRKYLVQKYTTLLVGIIRRRIMHTGNGPAELELQKWLQFATFDTIEYLFLESPPTVLRITSIIRGCKPSSKVLSFLYNYPQFNTSAHWIIW